MAGTTTTGQRCQSAWPKEALRISFGVIWLIDAILKWLPVVRADYMATIMGQAQGQPGWLRWWFDFWINLQHPRVNLFVDLVATVETLIALALIFGFARKLTYISAVGVLWATAEGFAGPYTSGASDIGTAFPPPIRSKIASTVSDWVRTTISPSRSRSPSSSPESVPSPVEPPRQYPPPSPTRTSPSTRPAEWRPAPGSAWT